MSLETTITRAWQRKAVWLWLLLPVSWLYGFMTILRRQLYQLGWISSYRAPIPVMVIGNITVGGSGKTPLIMSLVSYLQARGVSVGVISRGYGGDSSQMPALVTADSLPREVGDEPCLIVRTTGVALAVCPNRQQAIEMLLAAHPDLQLIIADDGLQHYALQRDIEWIVVDVARGFGNQQLLPTGFLREPLSRLQDATVIEHSKPETILNSKNSKSGVMSPRLTMQLHPDNLQLLWQPELAASQLQMPTSGMSVHAVSGIGYPQRFFMTLQTLGFAVLEHPYPDHHDFSLHELLQYQQHPVIVTSKDAVKIRALLMQHDFDGLSNNASSNSSNSPINDAIHELLSRLWVLPVTADLSQACYQTLNQQLKKLGIALASVR